MSPFELLIEPFVELASMRRALVAALAVSLGVAPLGVILLLRRMSLASDAMAHGLLPGVAIGFLIAGPSLPVMALGGLLSGLIVALLSGAVSRVTPLREDASLAAFYLISLALGVVIVSGHDNGEALMDLLFGNMLAVDATMLAVIAAIASASSLGLAVMYRPLIIGCFDPGFLGAVGGSGRGVHMGFLALVVLNLVGGFTVLGTLMVVGIMMLPAIAARFWSANVGAMIAIAIAIAAAASVIGLLVSYHAELPPGPCIVLTAGFGYALSLFFGRHGGLLTARRGKPHLEA